MALPLSREARWVFIGDSITDCNRLECAESLGEGYVRIIRDWLRASHPANAPEIINVGTSGNKITDLQGRWQQDVLAHQPSLVSVKIGINDVWHGLDDESKGTSLENFRKVYVELLASLKKAAPNAVLVLCEPSVIWAPAPEEGNEKLKPYVAMVQELAAQFGAQTVVKLHGAFESARIARPDIPWAPDGVHPSSSGHMLIARHWLAALGLL